ncbi:unnamed protein product [Blepharisma stoltei]|uniref:non-specific serine/threonine protein kinase n=1 Tax=Blepharisma stoltei TaxID=1481888 RepID=A0AAU9J811_9CILI|nr:unnamed protein product [Blepharisma stoltei]
MNNQYSIQLQKYEFGRALFDALDRNDPELLKLILDQYRNIPTNSTVAEINGLTPLHVAALKGNLECCETLLDYGTNIDINARDDHERTPLHIACLYSHLSIAQLLTRSGALLNISDIYGNTPLHYVILIGNTEFINWIFLKNPNTEVKNKEGKIPTEMSKKKNIKLLVFKLMRPSLGSDNFIKSRNSLKNIELISAIPSQPSCDSDEVPEFVFDSKLSPSDFLVLEQLGKGSFGEVFLVQMKSTCKFYAMKVLKKQKVITQNLIRYVMTERNVLTYIKHPFIVGLNYAFQTASKLFLVLDYCPGGDLGRLLNKEKVFSEERAKIYVCEILTAIEELHKRNIIFRDLKPENVVLDQEGHALLTDFGLSKEGIQTSQAANSFCGSIAYLAPEILRQKGHGKAVDWYLLGVLLYEMLIGVPPYFSNNKKQLLSNIQKAPLIVPSHLNQTTKNLLIGLLQKNFEKRLGFIGDAEEIKNHEYFYGVDWDMVLKKNLRPPKPVMKNDATNGLNIDFEEETETNENSNHLQGWSFVHE